MPLFKVISHSRQVPSSANRAVYLVDDNWDDWGKFRTQFYLIVFDEEGTKYEPGSVKIGSKGLRPGGSMTPGVRAPVLDKTFDDLGQEFFSLGQGETYYETFNTVPFDLKLQILRDLRDCAYDLTRFEQNLSESVMQQSLLRGIPEENVRSRLHRLAQGDATLTKFWFKFTLPSERSQRPLSLDFQVEPHSDPPTNVHVLIGRNGVGKSRFMQSIARAISGLGPETAPIAKWEQIKKPPADDFETEDANWEFAGLVFISFSAFDAFEMPNLAAATVPTTVIGLQTRDEDGSGNRDNGRRAKSREELAEDFVRSFEACRRGLKSERLRASIETLGADPLFADADIDARLDDRSTNWQSGARRLFLSLSSGHAIVLLTVTRLVQFVDERTLVLLDEPEGHLHPPLLSAFIRTLTDLLIRRNGVAIVATHSPVVLQEVPRSCVWKLRRSGAVSHAERLVIETFGENVGVLTREVFGLEVTKSGFHKLIQDSVQNGLTYEEILKKFGDQLGAESRAIARALIAARDAEGSA